LALRVYSLPGEKGITAQVVSSTPKVIQEMAWGLQQAPEKSAV